MAIKTIDILPTAQAAEGYDFSVSVAVVIDVLRATSVITNALSNGASAVAPVLSPEEGFALADKLGRYGVVLGGERNADVIPGYDLGNSPQDYAPGAVAGKTVVITTTNGTVALRASSSAKSVIAASMLNYKAAAIKAVRMAVELSAESVVFVCSGNYGALTLEDCFCAAVMADVAADLCPAAAFASDMAVAIHDLARGRSADDVSFISRSAHYGRLIAKGYSADVDFCLRHPDSLATVPVMCADGFIRLVE